MDEGLRRSRRLKANDTLSASLYLDNFKVEGDFGDGTIIIPALNGKLIQNLTVYDSENRADWSICDNTGVGHVLYGDRDLTAADFPQSLAGAETIRTACDSKLFTKDLATFTAGADITVYVTMDTRVLNASPDWLSDWTQTGLKVTTSNDVEMILYKKTVKAGEEVVLGTNGGLGDSANYIVIAVPNVGKGDVNLDGSVTAADAVLLLQYLLTQKKLTAEQAYQGDLIEDDRLNAADLSALKQLLIG